MIKNLIIGGRRSGRTTELIEQAVHQDKYIVVNDKARADSLFLFARSLGYNIRYPIILYEIMNSHHIREGRGFMNNRVLVDDADAILQTVIRLPIETMVIQYPSDSLKMIPSPNLYYKEMKDKPFTDTDDYRL